MLRKMELADLSAVLEIERITLHARWNEDQFRYELEGNDYAFLYVIEMDNKIVGFIDYWITFDTCQLANIAVLPAYQHRGYARTMMDQMFQAANAAGCENITLEVRKSNSIAQQFYQAYEFIEINIRKQYYGDNNEDAIVMMCALGGNWNEEYNDFGD